MNRRELLQCLSGCAALSLLPMSGFGGEKTVAEIPLTAPEVVRDKVKKFRPLESGFVPKDFQQRFGATHTSGRYCLTEEPFLLEGCRKMTEFGAGAIKLWFHNPRQDYPFHSDWSGLPEHPRLVDMAKHPYFLEAFEYPFSTFVLEITHLPGIRDFYEKNNEFLEYTEQFEELTAWLYEKYADRPVTFILQNWEGDWLFRSSYAATWSEEMLASLPDKTDRFTQWFAARQRGVEKARNAALADAKPRCRVMHAAEVNRVLDLKIGEPTLAELVLPHVPLDLVSWSSYDGMGSEIDLWHGMEIIKHQMRSSGFLPEPTVMIGEIGYPENEQPEQWLLEFWDRTLGTFFALDVPLILHWELYCNELTDKAKQASKPVDGVYKAEDCRGFWLYRPDGSLGHAGNLFKKLLEKSKA